jgi:hypothetical protein
MVVKTSLPALAAGLESSAELMRKEMAAVAARKASAMNSF